MHRFTPLPAVLCALALSIGPRVASAQQLPDSAQALVDSAAVQPDSAAPAARQERSDFERLTSDAVHQPGFFDAYLEDGRLYFVVPESRLGERFLLTFEASQGPGTGGIYGGTMLDNEARIVSFEKRQGRMFLIRHPHIYTAPEGSPEQRAIELTFGPSVLATARIEATRDSVDHRG